MAPPGEYRPDRTEGIQRLEDLPKPKVICRSRDYAHRRCPECDHSAYRKKRKDRTLHDLGDPRSERPLDIHVRYSVCFWQACVNSAERPGIVGYCNPMEEVADEAQQRSRASGAA
jgi:hypothetical protein